MTSLSASCSTMRNSKQLHLDPGKMAEMVRNDSATHPSNCTLLWCSKQPQSTRILGKLKCFAQAQTTGRLTRSKAFARSSTNATAASHSTRYFCCHFVTSGALNASRRRHQRNWSFTRDILRNQEEHRCVGLLRPLSTLLHVLQEFRNSSSLFFCQVQRNSGMEAVTSYSSLCCVLSWCLFQVTFFEPRQRFLASPQLLLQGLSCTFCTSSLHCQCIDQSFLFASQRSNNLTSSSSFSKICALSFMVGVFTPAAEHVSGQHVDAGKTVCKKLRCLVRARRGKVLGEVTSVEEGHDVVMAGARRCQGRDVSW